MNLCVVKNELKVAKYNTALVIRERHGCLGWYQLIQRETGIFAMCSVSQIKNTC